MFTLLLIIAVLAVAVILFFIVIELNDVEKAVSTLVQKLTKRYES